MSDKFEQWFESEFPDADLSQRETLKGYNNLKFGWNAAISSLQGEAPKGFALVPIKPTREMERVFREEDWEWRDVLAAAESITEEEYYDTKNSAAKIAELEAKLAEVEKDAIMWRSVSFHIEEAIRNGMCNFEIEDAYESAIQESKKGGA